MPLIINFLPNVSLVRTIDNIQTIYRNRRFNQLNYIDQNRQNLLNSKITAWSSIASAISTFKSALDSLIEQGIQSYTVVYSKTGYIYTAYSGDTEGEQHTIRIQQRALQHIIDSDPQSDTTAALGLSGQIGINGNYVTVSASDSLKDIADNINAETSLGVTAEIVAGRLRLTAKNTGTQSKITLQDPNNILHTLGFLADDSFGNPYIKNEVQPAQNAIIYFDGTQYESQDNSFSIGDFTITLLKNQDTPVMVKVEKDMRDAYAQIESFVTAFNSLMATINSHLKPTDQLYYDQGLQIFRKKIFDVINKEFDSIPEHRNELKEIGLPQVKGGIVSFTEAQLDILRTYQKEREKNMPAAIDDVINDIKSLEQAGIFSTENGQLKIDKETLLQNLKTHFSDVKAMLFGSEGILPALRSLMETASNEYYGVANVRSAFYNSRATEISSAEYLREIEKYSRLDAISQKNYFLSSYLI